MNNKKTMDGFNMNEESKNIESEVLSPEEDLIAEQMEIVKKKKAGRPSQYEKVKEEILSRINDKIECIFNDEDKTVLFKVKKAVRAKDPRKRRIVLFENSLNLGGVRVTDVTYLLERARIFS